MQRFVKKILSSSPKIRYVALYQNGELKTFLRPDLEDRGAMESEQYEELLVNPAILLLANQRGNIDCGGLEFVLIKYGRFFQYIRLIPEGHVSVCIEKDTPALTIARKITKILKNR